MKRVLLSLMLAAFVAAPLAACGKKGDPEVPAGQADTLKRKYPSVE